MWISRAIEARLQQSARTRPAIVLTGARQTGKTSTLRRLFPDYSFVSLDLPTEAEQAEKEPRNFLARYPAPVIIDEVQYAPGLFRHLKAEIDANRGRNGQFLLTGSRAAPGSRTAGRAREKSILLEGPDARGRFCHRRGGPPGALRGKVD
jgi:uncharacterized protein